MDAYITSKVDGDEWSASHHCRFIPVEDSLVNSKGRGKVHPITYPEGPEGRYVGVVGQRHAPAALTPGMRPSTHCIVGWVGHRAGLDRIRKFCLHRDSIPGSFSP
jgi:hypothetical protein